VQYTINVLLQHTGSKSAVYAVIGSISGVSRLHTHVHLTDDDFRPCVTCTVICSIARRVCVCRASRCDGRPTPGGKTNTRVGTLLVATIYLQMIQN